MRLGLGTWVASSTGSVHPLASTTNLDYSVSWVGNSFSGADEKRVQNFFIHMNTAPDGSSLVFIEEDYRGKSILYRWRP